jgi:hypothetical protein
MKSVSFSYSTKMHLQEALLQILKAPDFSTAVRHQLEAEVPALTDNQLLGAINSLSLALANMDMDDLLDVFRAEYQRNRPDMLVNSLYALDLTEVA